MGRAAILLLLGIVLAGCAVASQPVDTGNGTYLISAHASTIRGGATGAMEIANQDANTFCAKVSPGTHAIMLTPDTSAPAGTTQVVAIGNFGGGISADFHFRCGN